MPKRLLIAAIYALLGATSFFGCSTALQHGQKIRIERLGAIADKDCQQIQPNLFAFIDEDDGKRFGWYCGTIRNGKFSSYPNYYKSENE